MPRRIQRRRVKGWRMPPNTVSVARPSRFGNPFTIDGAIEAGYLAEQAPEMAVSAFAFWLYGDIVWQPERYAAQRERLLAELPKLRGKNLACFCSLDRPCHADVLLELANAPEGGS